MTVLRISIVVAACLLLSRPVGSFAQTRTDGGQNSSGGAAGTTDAAARQAPRAVGTYPPIPGAFQRGSQVYSTDSAQQGAVGLYFGLFRVITLLALFAGWVKLVSWMNQDSQALKVRPAFWNTLTAVCGFAAFFLALCMPAYVLSLGVLAAALMAPAGAYVRERNAKVPESSKLLTRNHLTKVAIRALARIGLKVGTPAAKAKSLGPEIVFLGKSATGREGEMVRNRQVENSKGYVAAREMVYDALMRRATDIHIEPHEDECAVRMRIDGVMHSAESVDRAIGEAIVNIVKVLGAMDITEKRRPQDGSFRAETEGREIDFRVATQGTRQGEKMSLRILDQSGSVSTLVGLGMRKQLQEQLAQIIHQPHGMLLVCGPTGAGKSTTLYAALNEIDSFQHNIITVEDPIEYKMNNVTQIEINTKAGQTFAGSLRSILRQDPDVVMIGEIRDAETAKIACQAANTGHMVFSTVHANDSFAAMHRLVDLGMESYMLADSISAILAQRLVRRLCPDCKEAYKPKPEFLEQANLPADKIEQFYRPPKQTAERCLMCDGLGYHGRIGVYELLVVSDRMRDMIRENAAMSALKAEARKNGMLYMKEEGLRLVVRGVTSVDELLRVVK